MNRAPLGNGNLHNSIIGPSDPLIRHLQYSIAKADQIRFLVAFLLESGVRLIGPALKDAARRGARIRILTGTYMSITEPSAIYYLLNLLGDAAEIRLFKDQNRSFHPKSYIFDYHHDPNASEVYVGSSNLSSSALITGIEWNYRIKRETAPADYARFSEEFERLWKHESKKLKEESLRAYAITWRQNALAKRESPAYSPSPKQKPEPRGAQIEALYYLCQAREEGIDKGLVIAATGVGKTYLAAFDSRTYERVLFVAHREEILRQAEDAFRNVRPNASIGYYSGGIYDTGCNICLATVQTLSRQEHLSRFARDHFHYVIIDEFHHAAADSYRALLNHFQPHFLLGLTATPYRTDNRDIYELCDNNVIYEIHLQEAIGRGLYFIGNYKRAHYIPYLLSGMNPDAVETWKSETIRSIEYPPGCLVQFDFRLLDLFEELAKRDPVQKRMREEFALIWERLGHRPRRLDIYQSSDIPMRYYLREGWLRFLASVDVLTDDEKTWLDTPAEELLRELEKTAMTKSYKIPTIGSLITSDGDLSMSVPIDTVGETFREYYISSKQHQQDLQDKSNRNWPTWSLEQFTRLARRNPVHYLSRSRFFHYDQINQVFSLDESLRPYAGPALVEHIKDILEYRETNHFAKRYRDQNRD